MIHDFLTKLVENDWCELKHGFYMNAIFFLVVNADDFIMFKHDLDNPYEILRTQITRKTCLRNPLIYDAFKFYRVLKGDFALNHVVLSLQGQSIKYLAHTEGLYVTRKQTQSFIDFNSVVYFYKNLLPLVSMEDV